MLVNSVGMFLLGVVDSMSLEWVTAILLFSDPQSKTILPHSQKLLMTLSQSAIQVCLFLTALPLLLSLLSLDILSTIVATFTLLGTYGYLFFYNNDILSLT